MGENPSHFSGAGLPVDSVTWYDAIEYCNRLSESRDLMPVYTVNGKYVSWDCTANGYRLLTEAEWEGDISSVIRLFQGTAMTINS